MSDTSWHSGGFDQLDALPEKNSQNRFWLKNKEERKVIFLESEPLNVSGHRK